MIPEMANNRTDLESAPGAAWEQNVRISGLPKLIAATSPNSSWVAQSRHSSNTNCGAVLELISLRGVPVRSVKRMGDPILRERARPVGEFGSRWLKSLVDAMWEAMCTPSGWGTVGFAAPQLGESVQVITLVYPENNRRGILAIPPTVLINPVVKAIDDSMDDDWETCLSIPGMVGKVPRHTRVTYTAFDLDGMAISGFAEGFHARILQHECDHLEGHLYLERIADLATFGFWEEIQSQRNAGAINLPVR